MKLNHLHYFYNITKTRNFIKKTRLSSVTPPTINKTIKKLEEKLNTQLLMRTTRQTTLTQNNEILLEHCQRMFDYIETLEHSLDQTHETITKPLQINTMKVFSIYLLPITLCELIERHPNIIPSNFEMLPQTIKRQILNNKLNITFTINNNDSQNITYTTLNTSPKILIYKHAHPLYETDRMTTKQLTHYPFVIPHFLDHEHLPPLDLFPNELHPHHINTTIELLQINIRMTTSRSLLNYFPKISVRQSLDNNNLRKLHNIQLDPPFELQTLTHNKIPQKTTTNILIDQLRTLITT